MSDSDNGQHEFNSRGKKKEWNRKEKSPLTTMSTNADSLNQQEFTTSFALLLGLATVHTFNLTNEYQSLYKSISVC